MAKPYDKDADRLILDFGDNPPIAHTVFPIAAQRCALQRVADGARIVQRCHAPHQKIGDAFGNRPIELGEFTDRRVGQLNLPGQAT